MPLFLADLLWDGGGHCAPLLYLLLGPSSCRLLAKMRVPLCLCPLLFCLRLQYQIVEAKCSSNTLCQSWSPCGGLKKGMFGPVMGGAIMRRECAQNCRAIACHLQNRRRQTTLAFPVMEVISGGNTPCYDVVLWPIRRLLWLALLSFLIPVQSAIRQKLKPRKSCSICLVFGKSPQGQLTRVGVRLVELITRSGC